MVAGLTTGSDFTFRAFSTLTVGAATEVYVIVTSPAATPVISVPSAFTVAIAGFEETTV